MTLLDSVLTLSPSVSLRPEPFGALAYHYGNRRLTFLKRPELVGVVRGLDGVRALVEVLEGEGIPAWQWPAFDAAVVRLMESDMIDFSDGGSIDVS